MNTYSLTVSGLLILGVAHAAVAATCVEISGAWLVEAEHSVTSVWDGDVSQYRDTTSVRVSIIQNGCSVSYVVANLLRTGQVNGTNVTFSGEGFLRDPDYTYTFAENTMTLIGTVNPDGTRMTGLAVGYASGVAVDPDGISHAFTQSQTSTVVFRRTVGPVEITPLRLGTFQADLTPPSNLDTPISPSTDTWLLGGKEFQSPLKLGVVADGVTPVLFMFTGSPGNYTIGLTTANGSYSDLPEHLFVLNQNHWITSTNITIPGNSGQTNGTAFAYLSGINWTNFTGVNTALNEVTANLTLNSSGTSIATAHFGVRPVPIVLVHGIASTGAAWEQEFINALKDIVPGDFIRPITYGEGPLAGAQWWPCSVDPLIRLVAELDAQLGAVEDDLKKQWAFTRYDVVGHSQGGVLLRMLCQTTGSPDQPAFVSTPVVSVNNLYRGRFRRVVTIGSPQNGSLLMYYLSRTPFSPSPWDRFLATASFALPAIDKFNPDGAQIRTINDPRFPVDPRIGFHCIQATINGGRPPSALWWENPLVYNVLHLHDELPRGPYAGLTRGEVLIPAGSDGVVDQVSQSGGRGTPQSYHLTDIAHAPIEVLFGVPHENAETVSGRLGSDVATLLSGSNARFGPFVLPPLITYTQMDKYNAIVPSVLTLDGLIRAFVPLDGATRVNCTFEVPTNFPLANSINWEASVYDANGVGTNGLSTEVNTNDSALMTLSVSSNVTGQVVVSGDYMTTNGDLVFAVPLVVLARSPAPGATLTNIEMQPSSISLDVGDTIAAQVIGHYSNGSQSLLYIPPGLATYSSSNPKVASVDTNGHITMLTRGTATIQVTVSGFVAESHISSIVPLAPKLLFAISTNETFRFTVLGTPGVTNVLQVSTNLIDWLPLAFAVPTNYLTECQDLATTNTRCKFYRVVIP